MYKIGKQSHDVLKEIYCEKDKIINRIYYLESISKEKGYEICEKEIKKEINILKCRLDFYNLFHDVIFRECKLIKENEPNIIYSSTVKMDCFAFRNKECFILKEMTCKNNHCKFYKDIERYLKSQSSLPEIKNDNFRHRKIKEYSTKKLVYHNGILGNR